MALCVPVSSLNVDTLEGLIVIEPLRWNVEGRCCGVNVGHQSSVLSGDALLTFRIRVP